MCAPKNRSQQPALVVGVGSAVSTYVVLNIPGVAWAIGWTLPVVAVTAFALIAPRWFPKRPVRIGSAIAISLWAVAFTAAAGAVAWVLAAEVAAEAAAWAGWWLLSRIRRGRHPMWCSPAHCNIRITGGEHRSAPSAVQAPMGKSVAQLALSQAGKFRLALTTDITLPNSEEAALPVAERVLTGIGEALGATAVRR